MKRVHNRWRYYTLFFTTALVFVSNGSFGQAQDSLFSPHTLKKLSLEELMNLEVTSVSKIPQKLTEVASAIQLITGEDIRRSTATNLPEALRLAPNLQVSQTNSHDWAIASRGFNGAPLSNFSLADKLLVMIDGRSVYTPLFGGVFWDAQQVFLEDLDRIEVVSGPGGTLWGDNAVNGVINVISKRADKTQGLYASAAMGSFLQEQAGIRFGGKAAKNIFYRLYGQFFKRNNTRTNDTLDAKDNWDIVHGGFRIDYLPSEKTTITLQGDLYKGRENSPSSTFINGQNILARWTHKFSDKSDLKLQAYFDRTFRNIASADFTDNLLTYDIDFQHRFTLGKRQQVLWGGSYRLVDDSAKVSPTVSFIPPHINLLLVTGFIQDQVSILNDRVQLTIGTKLSSNHYTGFEIQPSVRLAFIPNTQNTIWAAISRAVRVPSRFDVDILTASISTPDANFAAEKVIAYEIGYRVEPFRKIAISLATFYNRYMGLRSINYNPGGATPLIFANDQEAKTWGVELSGSYWMFDWWRLRAGYTYLGKKFRALRPAVVRGADAFQGFDPHNQAMLQSVVDLKKNIQLDVTARFVDSLTIWPLNPSVSQYFSLDFRIAWQYKRFEFSFVGRDILARRHIEFGGSRIPRNIYGKLIYRL